MATFLLLRMAIVDTTCYDFPCIKMRRYNRLIEHEADDPGCSDSERPELISRYDSSFVDDDDETLSTRIRASTAKKGAAVTSSSKPDTAQSTTVHTNTQNRRRTNSESSSDVNASALYQINIG